MFNLFKNGSPGHVLEMMQYIAHGGGGRCDESYSNGLMVEEANIERAFVVGENDESFEYVEECDSISDGPTKGPIKGPTFDFEVDTDELFPTNSIISGTFLGVFGTGDNILYTALFTEEFDNFEMSQIYDFN
ncbi:MAG: hypothetical protein AAFP17_02060 [Pseudomonadota bacterium]